MTMNLTCFVVLVGTPIAIVIVAVIGAYFYENDNEALFDELSIRPPAAELGVRHQELEEMLETVNRSRRARGAPERTLQELDPRRMLEAGRDDLDGD
jgi:hypothetical protein